MKEWIKITPLGGLDEIGSNMIHLETGSDSVIIDCGILFPDDDSYGINYLIPDFSSIRKIDAIVFTHGHEDHIGASPHIFKAFPHARVHASAFTKALIDEKLKYEGKKKKIEIFNKRSTLEFNEFTINPVQVNHSIPETFGILIKSKKENFCLFYISDFKVDDDSPYEPYFDFHRLKEMSNECSMRVLMPDSTNITSSIVKTPGEGELARNFEKAFRENDSNIFITTFSSNIHRLQSILSAAKKTKRNVIFSGRSLFRYSAVASELGLLKDLDIVVDAELFEPQGRQIILVSGCQGDFKSALNRLANRTDRHLKISEGDLFIYSAKSIPGNEKKISKIFNKLTDMGAVIIPGEAAGFHVSGHAGKKDLEILMKEFKPTHYIPCHGETFFLKKHVEFVKEIFPDLTPTLLTNGDSAFLNDKAIVVKTNSSPEEPLLIAGNGHVIERQDVRERRKIATQGMVCLSIYRKTDVIVTIKGVPKDIFSAEDARNIAATMLSDSKSRNYDVLIEDIRVAIRKVAGEKLGYRPVCIIQAHSPH